MKTLTSVIEDNVGLSGNELKNLMLKREEWKNFIISPNGMT